MRRISIIPTRLGDDFDQDFSQFRRFFRRWRTFNQGYCDVVVRAPRRRSIHAKTWTSKEIIVWLAGALAEQRATGQRPRGGSCYDRTVAWELARGASSSDREARAYLARMRRRARALLDNPAAWSMVRAMARTLLREGVIDGFKT